jgi:hypothetical protein
MNYFDNENKIIEWFQDVEPSSVYFPIETDELVAVFESIHNEGQWKLWKNSSGKSDPPPDFYCDELKLMMDIMRVDDHAHKNKKGKIVNPTNARESAMQKELRESGILDKFPNVENIICNAVTDLPTEQDHNYKFYKNNFIRTIEEHKRKIALYKQNHPDYKTIFFVLDESSAYFEGETKHEIVLQGMPFVGRPHIWFLDKAFIQVFQNSNIDYIVWFTPFKHFESLEKIVLPEIVVFDTSQIIEELQDYVIDNMVSCEV